MGYATHEDSAANLFIKKLVFQMTPHSATDQEQLEILSGALSIFEHIYNESRLMVTKENAEDYISLRVRIASIACVSIAVKWCDETDIFDMKRAIDISISKEEQATFSQRDISDLVMHLETKILVKLPIFQILESSELKKIN